MMKPLTILSLLFLSVAASRPALGATQAAQAADKSAPPQECVLTSEDYAVYSALLQDRGKPEDPEERWDDKPDLIVSEVTDSQKDAKSNVWGNSVVLQTETGGRYCRQFQFATKRPLSSAATAGPGDFLPSFVGRRAE
jgi:hypothetical protein